MHYSVFEDRATIIGSLANTAEEESVIVYDRAQAASVTPCLVSSRAE
jgi:hypothetical protein